MAVRGPQAVTDAPVSPFAQWTDRDIVDLIDQFPLAWVVSGKPGFNATPLPILVETDETGRPTCLIGHFAKSNPQVGQIRAEPRTLFLFSGPHGYVSPELVRTTRDWGVQRRSSRAARRQDGAGAQPTVDADGAWAAIRSNEARDHRLPCSDRCCRSPVQAWAGRAGRGSVGHPLRVRRQRPGRLDAAVQR